MAVGTGPRYGSRYGWADNDDDWAASDPGGGMNTNLERDEMLLFASVISSSTSAPPGSPANGDCYIVGLSGSGDWAGHDLDFTYYDGTDWKFIPPRNGMLVWNAALPRMMIFSVTFLGSLWGFLDKPISVLDILTAPPGSPGVGDAYLVDPTLPSGAFTARGDYLAVWTGTNWQFIPPAPGLQVWNVTAAGFTHYDGTAWV